MTAQSCELNTQQLREAIRAIYTDVVTDPGGIFDF